MDGLHADDAGNFLGPQDYRLAQSYPAVHAAHKVKLQKAIFGSPGNNEAHLVHMGGQQQPVSGGLLALLKDNEVAQGVGTDGVGVRLGLGADEVPHGSLVSGHAVEGAKLFQKLSHRAPSFPTRRINSASSRAVSSMSPWWAVSMGVCI